MSLRQPIDTSQLATDLSEMIFDLPVTCVYQGVTFTASAGDRTRQIDFQDHGVQNQDQLEIIALLSSLPSALSFAAEQNIDVDGSPYIIDSVSRNQDKVSVTLQLRTRYATNN